MNIDSLLKTLAATVDENPFKTYCFYELNGLGIKRVHIKYDRKKVHNVGIFFNSVVSAKAMIKQIGTGKDFYAEGSSIKIYDKKQLARLADVLEKNY